MLDNNVVVFDFLLFAIVNFYRNSNFYQLNYFNPFKCTQYHKLNFIGKSEKCP